MRSTVWLLLASVVSVGVLLLFVFPTRTLVDQHHQISAVEHQLSVIDAENAHLRHEVAALHQPATIERMASQEFGLVMKGQKAYAVLPSGSTSASGSSTSGSSGSSTSSTSTGR
jgi:cell division protein FtsB